VQSYDYTDFRTRLYADTLETKLMNHSLQAEYIGKKHIHLDTIDSTNSYALKLIANSTPIEGTAISADIQTAGKGQYGREWQGLAHENIYLSIILKPHFLKIHQQFLMNKAVTVAISEAIEVLTNIPVKIKWPNDLYIGHQKTGGLLIQNTLQGSKINTTIVGIGINVNQKSFIGLPNPTSIFLKTKQNWSLSRFYISIFNQLEKWYEKLKQLEINSIEKVYHQKLYRNGENVLFKINDLHMSGIVQGVDQIGRIVISHNGIIKAYHHGEINLELKDNK
jgi:BirA family biotin operon repressor/biotin-[acetyl-CoA-carboxylase] ligase